MQINFSVRAASAIRILILFFVLDASSAGAKSPVCEAIRSYPRLETEKLSFESGVISPLCSPYIRQRSRRELDACGNFERDPYASSSSSSTTSHYTWASRSEMTRRGKLNMFIDPEMQAKLPTVYRRVEELRGRAAHLCCGSDLECKKSMDRVEVKFCEPNPDPNSPDPCVFGGNFKMTGQAYSAVFRLLEERNRDLPIRSELRQIAARNLAGRTPAGESVLSSGSIVLSSYVPRGEGFASLEPTLLHEFGHACSMVKMQQQAVNDRSPKALRAARWLESARKRCQADLDLPVAYYDFWESVGESKSFAQCLYKLTGENQRAVVDAPCSGLCPGHFLEEAVGVTFSLLLGDLDGTAGAVFPQTCDHVRDGQHPMVSDVLDCLAQNSPRFRERLKRAHHCEN